MIYEHVNSRICDVCNAELAKDEVGHILYSYLYCAKCWKVHERNEREYRETHKETTIGWGI